MDEKRNSHRKRVLKAGTIEFHGGAIDCVIRNLSDTGAALEVESVVGVPAEFTLVVRADDLARKCRVVRRENKRLGVRFE
jgi:hypothetical protein